MTVPSPARPAPGQAATLRDRIGLDWLHAPFTRCVLDNAPLAAAPPHHAARVPDGFRGSPDLRACPACGRVYWPGGHVRRMGDRLRAFAATGPVSPAAG